MLKYEYAVAKSKIFKVFYFCLVASNRLNRGYY